MDMWNSTAIPTAFQVDGGVECFSGRTGGAYGNWDSVYLGMCQVNVSRPAAGESNRVWNTALQLMTIRHGCLCVRYLI